MEIGSHDRLQEGALSLKVANGVNNYPGGDGTSIETEQQRAGSVPPRPWVSGQCKVSDAQEQQPCWNGSHGANPVQPVHHAAMEDAHNLVAFSAIAGSLPPSSSSPCNVQPNTAQLYERFSQEMSSNGAQARLSAGTSEGSSQPPEDLKTLQTALSQAKHGHKPPNCDCEGPDCPDYLEWLKKKIKLASNENQGACKVVDVPQQLQPHLQQPHLQNHPQQYPQMNGGHRLPASYPQQQQGSHLKQATCSKSPIPCSPQVLSIAKEKNISLQAAIAIEALTQLSDTGPQAPGSPGPAPFNSNFHHLHRTQNLPSCPPSGNGSILSPPGSHSSSSRSQSVPPGSHSSHQTPVSSELHRPQSQGQPPHVAPLPSSTSPFPGQGKHPGSNSQHWQQGSGKSSEQRKPHKSGYNVAPVGGINPMSELKQLLGDTTGRFSGAPFKLPVAQQPRLCQNGSLQAQDNPALARIKQEPDSGEHYRHTASMGNFSMANCQQQGQNYPGVPLSPGQTSIRHSTQAALQQHLHYKRNLFSSHSPSFGAPGPRASLACQNLKKWWPQGETEGFPHLPIKQEPKKKKSNQGSPVIKSMSGMLAGPPLPKPKQIIIKKTKQKASMPTFLPHTQISVQKPAPALTSLQPGSLPPQPHHCNSTQAAAAGLPAPAQSQVSISNSPTTSSSILSAVSENTPALVGPPPSPVVTGHAQSAGAGGQSSSNTSTTTCLTSASSPSTSNSHLPSLVNVDPKYEELIRQFEAEFGESQPPNSKSLKGRDPPLEEGSLSLTGPSGPNPTPLPNPDENDQMEVCKGESGIRCETAPAEGRADGTQEGSPRVSEAPEKQQQPGALESMFSMPGSPLPKRMKIEASGDIAVLSTTCYSEEDTPTKDSLPSSPSLRGFLESPLRYLDTPTKTLFDTPSKDLQAEFPTCTCVGKSVHHVLRQRPQYQTKHLNISTSTSDTCDL